jgi:Holliday junction resolvase-like predicted endonuclease
MNIYGVVNSKNIHTDVAKTERGAKCYATRNGYKIISIRYNSGYHVDIIAQKSGGKWIKVK